jgi:hypothetical protein
MDATSFAIFGGYGIAIVAIFILDRLARQYFHWQRSLYEKVLTQKDEILSELESANETLNETIDYLRDAIMKDSIERDSLSTFRGIGGLDE